MKDLYRKLGIDQDAAGAEVAAALKLKPQFDDFGSILLDADRRAAYDGVHATVKAIGVLRHRLGLDSGDSWFLENCADFAPGVLLAEQYEQSSKAVPEESKPNRGHVAPKAKLPVTSQQKYLLVAVVVFAILIFLAYTFF